MRKWEPVEIREKLKATKKRIARKIKPKPFMLSAALMVGGFSAQGQSVAESDNNQNDYIAGIMKNNPGANIKSIEDYIFGDAIQETLTFEDAARDKTSFVFMNVVNNMNNIAQEGLKVWKNPAKKAQFVRGIFQTAVGYKSTQASCLASCFAALIKALEDQGIDTSFLPKRIRTYGNNLVAEKEMKDYIVSVKPGAGAIEKAIEENNVQPGDFVLIPRNSKNYHSVMYVGKNDKGEHIYSGCNNPAYKKTFDYYNNQAKRYKRDVVIVKMNDKFFNLYLESLKEEERKGGDKVLIITRVYDEMTIGKLIPSNETKNIDVPKNTKKENNGVQPTKKNKNKKEEGKKIIAQRIFKNARISRG